MRLPCTEVGVASVHLTLKIGAEPLEALDLRRGQRQLLTPVEHERDKRALSRRLTTPEVIAPPVAQPVNLSGQVLQSAIELVVDDGGHRRRLGGENGGGGPQDRDRCDEGEWFQHWHLHG